METVAFYSYKGGVGRTSLVANTARILAMSGRRVAALDLDLEAPGLHHKLGNSDVLGRARSGTLGGAVNVLLGTLQGRQGTCSVRETAMEADLPLGANGSLFLIPAGSAPSDAYWPALEQLNHAIRSPGRNGGLAEAILELQAGIAAELAPEFLLVDSRAGVTELGGLVTSILADRVVCLSTMAPDSVEGIRVVAEALRAAPRLASQGPLRIDFAITRVESGFVDSTEVRSLIQDLGGSAAVFPEDNGTWRFGMPKLFAATETWVAKSFPGRT